MQGVYDFSSCEPVVRAALEQGKYIVLNPSTGQNAPLSWLPSAGVPTVNIHSPLCFPSFPSNLLHLTLFHSIFPAHDQVKICWKSEPGDPCTEAEWARTGSKSFPNYLSPNYLPLWTKFQQALSAW